MSTSAHCLIVLLIYFACFPLYGMSRLFAAVIWQKQTVGAALPTVLCGDSVNWNISYNLALGQALTFSDGILKQMIFKNVCKRTPSFSTLNFFGFLKTSWKESEASLNCDSCDYFGLFNKFFCVTFSWLCTMQKKKKIYYEKKKRIWEMLTFMDQKQKPPRKKKVTFSM